ncbi:MAG: alpha/beta fold hydrolase BchO [Pseudomonadota bacterium]
MSTDADIPKSQPGAPDWYRERATWPLAEHSLFLKVDGHTWHAQRLGGGPKILLLHGTGASTHSWSGLAPLLASSYDVLSFDLPGHGFTQSAPGFSATLKTLPDAVSKLLDHLSFAPDCVIGHSAGAAIMIQLVVDGRINPQHLISINGALRPFPGVARLFAPLAAKALTFGGFAARALARNAQDRSRVERLLQQTGSNTPNTFVDGYARLLRYPTHVAGTLALMANWDLSSMPSNCRALSQPTLFIAGRQDLTVPPGEAAQMAEITSRGQSQTLAGLGHLAHEEAPHTLHDIIDTFISSN